MAPIILITDDAYYWIAMVSSLVGISTSTVVAIWHFRGLFATEKKLTRNTKTSILWSIPFALYAILTQFIWFFDILDPFSSIHFCRFNVIVSVNLLTIFKWTQHSMLILRLHEAFGQSALGYDKKKLIYWESFISFWIILIIILQLATTTVTLIPDQIPQCHLLVKEVYLMSLLLFDIVVGIVNGILFIKPIYKLKHAMDKGNVNSKLKKIAKKQMVLSLIAIISSVVSLFGFALMDIPQFNGGTDLVISTTCILLMYMWNAKWYKRLCCCFIDKINKNEKQMVVSVSSKEPTTTVTSGSSAQNKSLSTITPIISNTNSENTIQQSVPINNAPTTPIDAPATPID